MQGVGGENKLGMRVVKRKTMFDLETLSILRSNDEESRVHPTAEKLHLFVIHVYFLN